LTGGLFCYLSSALPHSSIRHASGQSKGHPSAGTRLSFTHYWKPVISYTYADFFVQKRIASLQKTFINLLELFGLLL